MGLYLPVWDDMLGDISQGIGTAALTYEAYPSGASYLAYHFQHNQNDSLSMRYQLPHRWKRGSDVKLHIHFIPAADPAGSEDIYFNGRYAWAKVGTAVAAWASWTTFNATHSVAPGDVDKPVIKALTTISPPSSPLESMFLLVWLERNSGASDTYTTNKAYGTSQANVVLLGLDVHYQSSKLGTKDEIPT